MSTIKALTLRRKVSRVNSIIEVYAKLFAFLFQGVFATVIDPSEERKRKKSKSDPEGAFIITVCISEQGLT